MIYIGIDPGAKGALAVISDFVTLVPFSEGDYLSILKDVSCMVQPQEIRCCLEKVSAMPGNGSVSMFNFGQNFGWIQGVLRAYKLPYQLIRPQAWKKEFSLNSEKAKSVTVCKRLFPDVSLLPTPRCRVENDGMAEALLMAEYARRRL